MGGAGVPTPSALHYFDRAYTETLSAEATSTKPQQASPDEGHEAVSDPPLVFPVAGEVSGEGLLLCRMRVVFGRAVCEEVAIPFNLVKAADQFERYMDCHRLIRDWRGNVPESVLRVLMTR